MEHVISVENMRLSDKETIDAGTPSLILMQRAAQGIRDAYAYEGKNAVIVGSGNNGGDGFALATILKSEGKDVEVISVSDHYSEDSSYYKRKAEGLGVKVRMFEGSGVDLSSYDTIVDCLLGTGFKGEVKGSYKDAVKAINESGAFVISADINSGMNGDTGEYSLAVRSDITVTVGYLKKGLVAALVRKDDAVRSLVRADIGIGLSREEDLLLSPDEWSAQGLPSDRFEVSDPDGRTYYKTDLPVKTISYKESASDS